VVGSLHVDTDCGVDDALALMLLVRAGARIASVSAVFGNARADQAAVNASMVLRHSRCGADVFVGASRPLSGEIPERRLRGHGYDGLGGKGGSFRRRLAPLQRPHAASRLSFAPQGRIGGLFLGPLTNLALAVPDDPYSFRAWAPMVMAGAFEVASPEFDGADFNTWSDPEALQRVLINGVRPRLAPLDVTSQVAFDGGDFLARARASTWRLMADLAGAFETHMAFQVAQEISGGWRPHDAVTAAAWLWPELFMFEPAALAVSPTARGLVMRTQGQPNAEVAVSVDATGVRERILQTLFGGTD
jgi:inosine-uridine nucleoside N-ribohydrolase